MPKKRGDYTGMRFNKLKVIKLDEERSTKKAAYWVVKCDCGVEYSACIYEVKKGKIKQCKKCSNRNLSIRYTIDPIERAVNRKFKTFSDSAKVRNHEFKLTKEDVKELIFKNCYYCGKEPILTEKKLKVNYNSIDRVNNKLGYTKENCVPCCRKCNTIKGAITEEMVIKLYEEIRNRN